MKLILRTILTLLFLLPAVTVQATYWIQQINDPFCDCDSPVLATSADGSILVAWVEEGCDMWETDIVISQILPPMTSVAKTLPERVSHGPGHLVDVCWSREGFSLVMASGGYLVAYQSDMEGNFDTGDFQVLTPYPDGFFIHTIDLWGPASDAAGPHAFMAIGGTLYLPETDDKVLHTSRSASGWSSLEVVAENLSGPGWPQISWGIGPAGPLPMIYYLDDVSFSPEVVYTTKWLDTGWDEPTPVPGPVAGPFAVDRGGFDQRSVLGLGLQPTCPCGTIHHVGTEPNGSWMDPEHLTVDYFTHYDWPMSANVKIDDGGRVHAFWCQQGSTYQMDPKLITLEYWVGDQGVWSDQSVVLDEQEVPGIGYRVAMDLTAEGKPAFAWSRKDTIGGEPQPRAIWVARPVGSSGIPDGRKPEHQLGLKAHPNPFNPLTTLSYTLPRVSSVELAVYDVSGKLVRRLDAGVRTAGLHEVAWDGRDDRGREAISGLYLGRISAAGLEKTVKLMLVR